MAVSAARAASSRAGARPSRRFGLITDGCYYRWPVGAVRPERGGNLLDQVLLGELELRRRRSRDLVDPRAVELVELGDLVGAGELVGLFLELFLGCGERDHHLTDRVVASDLEVRLLTLLRQRQRVGGVVVE